ncbi:MAG TPA: hypothetical protein VN157_16290 [Caulobacter sp.]|nr:hypothetical protein [Caulobacter sp.]
MNAPTWYADWRHDAFHELMAKQEDMNERYQTKVWPRYDYDLDAGTLTFSDPTGPKVVADIQVVGTTATKDWLWSWANSHWPVSSVEDLEKVRAFGAEHGIEELTSETLENDNLNSLGWELSAVAARILGAVGAYRPPRDNGGGLFLIYRSIRSVS